MGTRTLTEYVTGELVNVNNPKKTSNVKVKLTVGEFTAAERHAQKRWLICHDVPPMSGMEDGDYKLRYVFDGQQQEHLQKFQGGKMQR